MKSKILIAALCSTIFAGCGYIEPMPEAEPHQHQIQEFIPEQSLHCDYNKKTIIVSLSNGQGDFIACENYKVQRYGRLSAGDPRTHRTPRGDFKVQWKAWEYDSKKYPSKNGNRNMDRAIFFTTKGHAIHIGNIKRYSHGCVRVQRDNATWLYNWADYNTNVIVQSINKDNKERI